MKKLNLKGMLNLRSFALVGIFTVAVLATSCDKGDDVFYTEPVIENDDLKAGKAVKKGDASIAEIVLAAAGNEEEPQFTLLLGALEYAGLTSVFAGTDQYTVFAPTDQAFIDLVTALSPLPEADSPFEAIDLLLGEGTVANVLLYHVTEGRRAANSVVPKNGTRTIKTLLGATFDVNPDLSIDAVGNSANIISANISASNGIIHVIDAVILPIE